jgi:hypothetical protein
VIVDRMAKWPILRNQPLEKFLWMAMGTFYGLRSVCTFVNNLLMLGLLTNPDSWLISVSCLPFFLYDEEWHIASVIVKEMLYQYFLTTYFLPHFWP